MQVIATLSSDLILKSPPVRRKFQRILLNNLRKTFKLKQISLINYIIQNMTIIIMIFMFSETIGLFRGSVSFAKHSVLWAKKKLT